MKERQWGPICLFFQVFQYCHETQSLKTEMMKQFGEITTWLKGHISLISLVVLGIGNHFVSDDLFFCPCGGIERRYVFTFSLAFTPAALLLCFGKFTAV